MASSDEQWQFLRHVAQLITWAAEHGYKLTVGDAYRSEEEQRRMVDTGKSKTMDSRHRVRCAVDLNVFVNGTLTYKKEDMQPLGDYWESLHEKNKWGGNWTSFVDCPHFERQA